MNSRGHQLRKGVAGGIGIYAAMAAGMVGGFLSSVLLVRHLTQAEFGVYRLFGSLVAVGAVAFSLGVDKALVRMGAELHGNDNFRGYLALNRILVATRVLMLLAVALVLLVFREPIGRLLNLPDFAVDWLPVSAAALLVFGINSLWGSAFLAARLDQAHEAMGQILTQLGLLGGLAVVVGLGFGLEGAIVVWLASYCLAFVYYTVVNLRWLGTLGPRRHEGTRVDAAMWKRVALFSGTSYLGLFLTSFRDLSADNLLISHFLAPEQVAIYSLAGSLVLLVSRLNPASILRAVVMVMMVSRLTGGGGRDDLCGLHRSLNKLVVFVTLPLYAMLILLGPEIIHHVFTGAYAASYGVLVILSCFFFVGGFEYTYLPLIYTLEKLHMLLVGGMLGLVNLGLAILLIPRLGIQGAALATGFISLVALGVNWWYFRLHLRLPLVFPWKVLVKCALNLLPGVALALLLRSWVQGPLTLLALLCVCALSFLGACYVNKIFDQTERDMINQAIGRKLLVF
jgi:O-antigen/teichoic acid export membrane protein